VDSKIAFILIITLSLPAAALSSTTNVVLEENGNSAVFMVFEGEGTVEVPLPLDVPEPLVEGALYVISQQGVQLSLEGDDTAVLSYTSSILTSKNEGVWSFSFQTPETKNNEVILSLPLNSNLKNVEPRGVVSVNEDSRVVNWQTSGRKTLSAAFEYTKASPTSTVSKETTTIESRQVDDETGLGDYLVYIILLVAIAAVILFSYQKKTKKPSKGMIKVMRTLSGNEYKMVDTLLKQKEFGMRRSDLERASSLAKSSLAMSVTNLERKNIVDVDRTRTVHYIELSKWFKEL